MNITSKNPATGSLLWTGAPATSEEILKALAQAKKAFVSWKKTPFEERAEIALRFTSFVIQERAFICKAICEETGKTWIDSSKEVDSLIAKVEISIKAYEERCQTKDIQTGHTITKTIYMPHGVVAVFGPCNFPAHLPNSHIVPALIAGNCVLFKPSEKTPMVGEMMASFWEKAGLKDGVLQLLQGGKEVAEEIGSLPDVQGIFFTGSAAAGEAISKQALSFPGRILALEMGGNNPLIVSEVASIEHAVDVIIESAFISSGQRCTCARRLIFVENAGTEKILELLCSKTKALTVGPYTQTPEVFMGPVISEEAALALFASYKKMLSSGGKALVPMKQSKAFVWPGIVDMTKGKSEDKEFFGPLLQVFRVKTCKEAIELANSTSYGLAAGILTKSKEEFDAFLEDIRAGAVSWNHPITGASSLAPFGGIGRSGNHRPSGYLACDFCSYPVAVRF
jgi:succinylglutamic semialdehyde dehydrogenase